MLVKSEQITIGGDGRGPSVSSSVASTLFPQPAWDTLNSKDRSSGLHVSEVIRDLAIQMKVLTPEDDEEDFQWNLRMAMGVAFERFVFSLYPASAWHPGELYLDGLAGTPDGFGMDDPARYVINGRDGYGADLIEEVKLTWQSTRRDIRSSWLRLTQVKAYCRMSGLNVARLHIGHVNGNYRGSGPEYWIHRLQFTQLELDENWQMILWHAVRQFGHKPVKGEQSNAGTSVG